MRKAKLVTKRGAYARVGGVKAHFAVTELECLHKILSFGKIVVVRKDAFTQREGGIL